MPIYEFRCEACNRITVQRLPISSQRRVVKCDFCDEIKAKKIISSSTFVLKGGGWYADAYNKKGD